LINEHEDTIVEQRLKLRHAYTVRNDAGSHYRLHAHLFHELVLVLSGEYRVRCGKEERIATSGDILLYTAHTPHEEWVDGNTAMTWLCWFEGDVFEQDEPVFRRDQYGKIETLLAELSSFYTFSLYTNSRSLEGECLDVLKCLINELKHLNKHGAAETIEEARAFVRANIMQPLSVEELAERAGFSRSHFSQLYRSIVGHTPWNDIQRIRVEEAKRLIETTKLPLREIAPRVGIANEYHLSRLLKSVLGLSVRDLRRPQPD